MAHNCIFKTSYNEDYPGRLIKDSVFAKDLTPLIINAISTRSDINSEWHFMFMTTKMLLNELFIRATQKYEFNPTEENYKDLIAPQINIYNALLEKNLDPNLIFSGLHKPIKKCKSARN